jgi:tetratricopeptide (TPR) repeat protein
MDAAYVARLVAFLGERGVTSWYDRQLVVGDAWERLLPERIVECAAFVVVMSPTAGESEWVGREVDQARHSGRPVCPLLLSGESMPALAGVQYEDVTDESMPSDQFVARLEELVAAPRPVQRRARLVGPGFPLRNPRFVGRDRLLRVLRTGLLWGPAVVVHGVHGTGGVGKTQLVVEYAYRHVDDYDLIGWIDAEQADLIPNQLAALADAVGISVDAVALAAAVADQVVAALASTHLRWLLIFDNVVARADVEQFVPRGGRGQVLVTSRQTGWAELGPVIEVDVLPRGDAVTLLRRRVTAGEAVADTICELLGDLPLALEQAGAFLHETQLPPAEYLQMLRTQEVRTLAEAHPVDVTRTVATVWEVSRARVAQANPAAAVLLQLCAFLGPEPIPLDLFIANPQLLPAPLDAAAVDPVGWPRTVGALLRFSLARASQDQASISVHRVLAAVLRGPTPEQDEPEPLRHVITILAAATPTGHPFTDVDGWPTWVRLLPHILAILNHLPQRHDDTTALDLGNRAAAYLEVHGKLTAAIDLYEQVITGYRRVLGDEHSNTLDSRNNLALAYRTAGRVSEAIDLFERVLADFRRVLGDDHPNTLITATNLAGTYRAAGRVSEAIDLNERALTDVRRVLGDDHPDTLTFRNNLALAYRAGGRVSEAIELFEQILIDRRRVLGDDHPDTLTTYNRLAVAYQAAGRLSEAIGLYERVLADLRRVLGDDHPDTLDSRNNLALAYQTAGQVSEAINLYEQVLADCERILGQDYPLTTTVRKNLADARTTASS